MKRSPGLWRSIPECFGKKYELCLNKSAGKRGSATLSPRHEKTNESVACTIGALIAIIQLKCILFYIPSYSEKKYEAHLFLKLKFVEINVWEPVGEHMKLIYLNITIWKRNAGNSEFLCVGLPCRVFRTGAPRHVQQMYKTLPHCAAQLSKWPFTTT